MPKGRRPRTVAQAASVVLVAAGTLAAVLLPVTATATSSSSSSADGGVLHHGDAAAVHHMSLMESEGAWVLLLVAVPTVVALAPMLVQQRWAHQTTIAAAILLAGFALVGVLTIGRYMVPGVAAAVLALFLPAERTRHRSGYPAPRQS